MNRLLNDYKGWIQNKAEEISAEEYDSEFYDLHEDTQAEVYNRAIDAYKDAYADYIDYTYETFRDKQMMGKK